jgi:hypothetical protein
MEIFTLHELIQYLGEYTNSLGREEYSSLEGFLEFLKSKVK